jgi:response regulator RpfG family c-di-GMP phosphodiesterase
LAASTIGRRGAAERVARIVPVARCAVTDRQAGGDSISVILVDDQPLLRKGFRMVLEEEPGIVIVGEASDGAAAVELARCRHPDVVVMDVRMPGMDGIEATRAIIAAEPRPAS